MNEQIKFYEDRIAHLEESLTLSMERNAKLVSLLSPRETKYEDTLRRMASVRMETVDDYIRMAKEVL